MEEYIEKIQSIGIIIIILIMIAFVLYVSAKILEIYEYTKEIKAYNLISREEELLIRQHQLESKKLEDEIKANKAVNDERIKTQKIIQQEEIKRTNLLSKNGSRIITNIPTVKQTL